MLPTSSLRAWFECVRGLAQTRVNAKKEVRSPESLTLPLLRAQPLPSWEGQGCLPNDEPTEKQLLGGARPPSGSPTRAALLSPKPPNTKGVTTSRIPPSHCSRSVPRIWPRHHHRSLSWFIANSSTASGLTALIRKLARACAQGTRRSQADCTSARRILVKSQWCSSCTLLKC